MNEYTTRRPPAALLSGPVLRMAPAMTLSRARRMAHALSEVMDVVMDAPSLGVVEAEDVETEIRSALETLVMLADVAVERRGHMERALTRMNAHVAACSTCQSRGPLLVCPTLSMRRRAVRTETASYESALKKLREIAATVAL